jgi:hypothetical protein
MKDGKPQRTYLKNICSSSWSTAFNSCSLLAKWWPSVYLNLHIQTLTTVHFVVASLLTKSWCRPAYSYAVRQSWLKQNWSHTSLSGKMSGTSIFVVSLHEVNLCREFCVRRFFCMFHLSYYWRPPFFRVSQLCLWMCPHERSVVSPELRVHR